MIFECECFVVMYQFGCIYCVFMVVFEVYVGQLMLCWCILLVLYDNIGGGMVQKQLVECLQMDFGVFICQFKVLEQFGWIECIMDVCDNCLINVLLLDVGLVIVFECMLCCIVFINVMFDGLLDDFVYVLFEVLV